MEFVKNTKLYRILFARPYITSFCAGAGLELFMNFFHVGEASIYRSISRNMSTSNAERQFEAERLLYEKFIDENNGKENNDDNKN